MLSNFDNFFYPEAIRLDMPFDRYNWENLKKAINNPLFINKECGRILNKIEQKTKQPYRYLDKKIFQKKYGKGIDVMEQDWDNLIILDACRYDIFKEANYINGDLQEVVSKGSSSWEFMKKNFQGKEIHDTVYVTANGKVPKLDEKNFYKIICTYGEEYQYRTKDRYDNYSPELVTDIALKNYTDYIDKRYIVHYMQPHAPYLGEKAEKVRESLTDEHGFEFKGWKSKRSYTEEELIKYRYENPDHIYNDLEDFFQSTGTKYVDHNTIRRVYIENLNIVLNHVEDLLKEFQGKTIITSDHGELLCEPKFRFDNDFGHSGGEYIPELRFVPWLEINSKERKKISPGEPRGINKINEDDLEEHLHALGYR